MVKDFDSFLGLGALRAVIVYLLCYLFFRNLLRKRLQRMEKLLIWIATDRPNAKQKCDLLIALSN